MKLGGQPLVRRCFHFLLVICFIFTQILPAGASPEDLGCEALRPEGAASPTAKAGLEEALSSRAGGIGPTIPIGGVNLDKLPSEVAFHYLSWLTSRQDPQAAALYYDRFGRRQGKSDCRICAMRGNVLRGIPRMLHLMLTGGYDGAGIAIKARIRDKYHIILAKKRGHLDALQEEMFLRIKAELRDIVAQEYGVPVDQVHPVNGSLEDSFVLDPQFGDEVFQMRVDSEVISIPMEAIGHTRWSTFGKPSNPNTHPFEVEIPGLTLPDGRPFVAVLAHNGNFMTYELFRPVLLELKAQIQGETDSEVLAFIAGFMHKGKTPEKPLVPLRQATERVLRFIKYAEDLQALLNLIEQETEEAKKHRQIAIDLLKGELSAWAIAVPADAVETDIVVLTKQQIGLIVHDGLTKPWLFDSQEQAGRIDLGKTLSARVTPDVKAQGKFKAQFFNPFYSSIAISVMNNAEDGIVVARGRTGGDLEVYVPPLRAVSERLSYEIPRLESTPVPTGHGGAPAGWLNLIRDAQQQVEALLSALETGDLWLPGDPSSNQLGQLKGRLGQLHHRFERLSEDADLNSEKSALVNLLKEVRAFAETHRAQYDPGKRIAASELRAIPGVKGSARLHPEERFRRAGRGEMDSYKVEMGHVVHISREIKRTSVWDDELAPLDKYTQDKRVSGTFPERRMVDLANVDRRDADSRLELEIGNQAVGWGNTLGQFREGRFPDLNYDEALLKDVGEWIYVAEGTSNHLAQLTAMVASMVPKGRIRFEVMTGKEFQARIDLGQLEAMAKELARQGKRIQVTFVSNTGQTETLRNGAQKLNDLNQRLDTEERIPPSVITNVAGSAVDVEVCRFDGKRHAVYTLAGYEMAIPATGSLNVGVIAAGLLVMYIHAIQGSIEKTDFFKRIEKFGLATQHLRKIIEPTGDGRLQVTPEYKQYVDNVLARLDPEALAPLLWIMGWWIWRVGADEARLKFQEGLRAATVSGWDVIWGKHGPYAILRRGMGAIVFLPSSKAFKEGFDVVTQGLRELRSRVDASEEGGARGNLIVLMDAEDHKDLKTLSPISEMADVMVPLPDMDDPFTGFMFSMLFIQLLTVYGARARFEPIRQELVALDRRIQESGILGKELPIGPQGEREMFLNSAELLNAFSEALSDPRTVAEPEGRKVLAELALKDPDHFKKFRLEAQMPGKTATEIALEVTRRITTEGGIGGSLRTPLWDGIRSYAEGTHRRISQIVERLNARILAIHQVLEEYQIDPAELSKQYARIDDYSLSPSEAIRFAHDQREWREYTETYVRHLSKQISGVEARFDAATRELLRSAGIPSILLRDTVRGLLRLEEGRIRAYPGVLDLVSRVTGVPKRQLSRVGLHHEGAELLFRLLGLDDSLRKGLRRQVVPDELESFRSRFEEEFGEVEEADWPYEVAAQYYTALFTSDSDKLDRLFDPQVKQAIEKVVMNSSLPDGLGGRNLHGLLTLEPDKGKESPEERQIQALKGVAKAVERLSKGALTLSVQFDNRIAEVEAARTGLVIQNQAYAGVGTGLEEDEEDKGKQRDRQLKMKRGDAIRSLSTYASIVEHSTCIPSQAPFAEEVEEVSNLVQTGQFEEAHRRLEGFIKRLKEISPSSLGVAVLVGSLTRVLENADREIKDLIDLTPHRTIPPELEAEIRRLIGAYRKDKTVQFGYVGYPEVPGQPSRSTLLLVGQGIASRAAWAEVLIRPLALASIGVTDASTYDQEGMDILAITVDRSVEELEALDKQQLTLHLIRVGIRLHEFVPAFLSKYEKEHGDYKGQLELSGDPLITAVVLVGPNRVGMTDEVVSLAKQPNIDFLLVDSFVRIASDGSKVGIVVAITQASQGQVAEFVKSIPGELVALQAGLEEAFEEVGATAVAKQAVTVRDRAVRLGNGTWLDSKKGGAIEIAVGARIEPNAVLNTVDGDGRITVGKALIRSGSIIEHTVTLRDGVTAWGHIYGTKKLPVLLGWGTQILSHTTKIEPGAILLPLKDSEGKLLPVIVGKAGGGVTIQGPNVIWGDTNIDHSAFIRPNSVIAGHAAIGEHSSVYRAFLMGVSGATENKTESARKNTLGRGILIPIKTPDGIAPFSREYFAWLKANLAAFRFGQPQQEKEAQILRLTQAGPVIHPHEIVPFLYLGTSYELSVRSINGGANFTISDFSSTGDGWKSYMVAMGGSHFGVDARVKVPAYVGPDAIVENGAEVTLLEAAAGGTYGLPQAVDEKAREALTMAARAGGQNEISEPLLDSSKVKAVRSGYFIQKLDAWRAGEGRLINEETLRVHLGTLETLVALAEVSAERYALEEDGDSRLGLQAEVAILANNAREGIGFVTKLVEMARVSPERYRDRSVHLEDRLAGALASAGLEEEPPVFEKKGGSFEVVKAGVLRGGATLPEIHLPEWGAHLIAEGGDAGIELAEGVRFEPNVVLVAPQGKTIRIGPNGLIMTNSEIWGNATLGSNVQFSGVIDAADPGTDVLIGDGTQFTRGSKTVLRGAALLPRTVRVRGEDGQVVEQVQPVFIKQAGAIENSVVWGSPVFQFAVLLNSILNFGLAGNHVLLSRSHLSGVSPKNRTAAAHYNYMINAFALPLVQRRDLTDPAQRDLLEKELLALRFGIVEDRRSDTPIPGDTHTPRPRETLILTLGDERVTVEAQSDNFGAGVGVSSHDPRTGVNGGLLAWGGDWAGVNAVFSAPVEEGPQGGIASGAIVKQQEAVEPGTLVLPRAAPKDEAIKPGYLLKHLLPREIRQNVDTRIQILRYLVVATKVAAKGVLLASSHQEKQGQLIELKLNQGFVREHAEELRRFLSAVEASGRQLELGDQKSRAESVIAEAITSATQAVAAASGLEERTMANIQDFRVPTRYPMVQLTEGSPAFAPDRVARGLAKVKERKPLVILFAGGAFSRFVESVNKASPFFARVARERDLVNSDGNASKLTAPLGVSGFGPLLRILEGWSEVGARAGTPVDLVIVDSPGNRQMLLEAIERDRSSPKPRIAWDYLNLLPEGIPVDQEEGLQAQVRNTQGNLEPLFEYNPATGKIDQPVMRPSGEFGAFSAGIQAAQTAGVSIRGREIIPIYGDEAALYSDPQFILAALDHLDDAAITGLAISHRNVNGQWVPSGGVWTEVQWPDGMEALSIAERNVRDPGATGVYNPRLDYDELAVSQASAEKVGLPFSPAAPIFNGRFVEEELLAPGKISQRLSRKTIQVRTGEETSEQREALVAEMELTEAIQIATQHSSGETPPWRVQILQTDDERYQAVKEYSHLEKVNDAIFERAREFLRTQLGGRVEGDLKYVEISPRANGFRGDGRLKISGEVGVMIDHRGLWVYGKIQPADERGRYVTAPALFTEEGYRVVAADPDGFIPLNGRVEITPETYDRLAGQAGLEQRQATVSVSPVPPRRLETLKQALYGYREAPSTPLSGIGIVAGPVDPRAWWIAATLSQVRTPEDRPIPVAFVVEDKDQREVLSGLNLPLVEVIEVGDEYNGVLVLDRSIAVQLARQWLEGTWKVSQIVELGTENPVIESYETILAHLKVKVAEEVLSSWKWFVEEMAGLEERRVAA